MQQTTLIPTTTTTKPPPAERRPPRPHVIKTALGAFLSLFLINFIVLRLSFRAASAASAVKPHRISFNQKCVTLLLLHILLLC